MYGTKIAILYLVAKLNHPEKIDQTPPDLTISAVTGGLAITINTAPTKINGNTVIKPFCIADKCLCSPNLSAIGDILSSTKCINLSIYFPSFIILFTSFIIFSTYPKEKSEGLITAEGRSVTAF